MAYWAFDCPQCDREIVHSQIEEAAPHHKLISTARKPDMPQWGLRLECSHCKASTLFRRHQLIFRGKSPLSGATDSPDPATEQTPIPEPGTAD